MSTDTRPEADEARPENVAHMKWWGWGVDGVAFHHEDKPAFGPFVQRVVDLDVNTDPTVPQDLDALPIPEPKLTDELSEQLRAIVGARHVHTDAHTRIVHTYGKSLRDLVRLRTADIPRIPDAVLYPADEAEVQRLVDLAVAEDAVLIPFGGGSNISGSLEAPPEEPRPVLSVDLGRLNKLIDIDTESGLARIQAGTLGPDIEQQLGARGWTLGHFPDSFTHSTLGGWVATRSSGMQSDKYGDIADITRGFRVAMPGSTLVDPGPAQHRHRPECAGDDPGQRGSARRDHRGHRAGAPAAGGAADPRLPVPLLGRGSRGHAGDLDQ